MGVSVNVIITSSIIVNPPLISDHSLIRVIFDAASVHVSTQNAPVTRCQWHSFDQDDFISELQQSPLELDPPSDVNKLVECYDTTLTELLDKYAPKRQVKTRVPVMAPWFDEDCRRC